MNICHLCLVVDNDVVKLNEVKLKFDRTSSEAFKDLCAKFQAGIDNLAPVSLQIGYPTIASAPYCVASSVSASAASVGAAAEKKKEAKKKESESEEYDDMGFSIFD